MIAALFLRCPRAPGADIRHDSQGKQTRAQQTDRGKQASHTTLQNGAAAQGGSCSELGTLRACGLATVCLMTAYAIAIYALSLICCDAPGLWLRGMRASGAEPAESRAWAAPARMRASARPQEPRDSLGWSGGPVKAAL